MDTAKFAKNMGNELKDSYDDRLTATPLQQRSHVLFGKISDILSASYADSGIKYALQALDATGTHNTPEFRRQIRLDVQKEVIDCNAEIIDQFGTVAEVRLLAVQSDLLAEASAATEAGWIHNCQTQETLRRNA